jgi:hypothetical protein
MIGKSGMSLACSSAAAVILLSGCSLVYDTGDLRAGRDGGISADADPDALFVARVMPDSVFEGEGSSFVAADEAMVRAIPIVLEGQNMTAETVFTIEGLGLDGTIEDVAVSGDGHFAAFSLRVPIVDSLADEQSDSLVIRLAKGDETADAPPVVVTGLDALERTGGGIDTDELHDMYTHVVLSGQVTASGTAPLRLVATAGISIDGALHADGGTAPNAGPGGCPGGGSASNAECGNGSGKAGESGTGPGGGGGGGYGTVGFAGTGGDGQAGGTAGERFVVALPPAEGATAHGAGGGGGGEVAVAPGGRGGGSGGVVELTTPAVLSVSATAIVSAAGGDGQAMECATGGGGGGGSGGAILFRAGTLVAAAGASASAAGGHGTGGSGCAGGDGGSGRIRIDRGNDTGIDADPAAFVGPMPVMDGLPLVVDDAALSVGVRADATEHYQMFAGETPFALDTDGGGLGTADVTLEPGLNHLCVQVAAGANLDYPEAKNCVDVAYIEP